MSASTAETVTLKSLSDIPADPHWRFPQLAFDSTGYPLPAEWLDDLKTPEQRQASGPLPDQYGAAAQQTPDPWNTFTLEKWDAGDEALVDQVFETNNLKTLLTLVSRT
jgi:hypothetical protein